MTQRFDRRQWMKTAGASALAAACPAWAQTADFPNKPITLVVGYPPGGSTDLTGRIVATELGKRLGTQVIVENLGGGGGTLGAQKVAQAAADGYTLLVGSNNEMAISGLVNQALRYDAQKHFTPLGLIASQPMLLTANPATGIKDVAGFIALAKQRPGKLNYGSPGIGTALHLAGEMVKESAGVFIVHIPYKGAGPMTTDLLGGQLELGMFVLSSGLPHVRSGKLVALGTTAARRSSIAGDIPALAEHPLLSKVDISSWFGLWGPAGLPAPVAARLRTALAEALASPELRTKLGEAGATVWAPGADLAAYQANEIQKYRRVVEFAKIRE